ncbi:porin [Bradyrhizobium sp. CB82]|uniref:porin n=1 Tax=Bradyrhizobium sp. CB82 TaxID=3039159 RepID=UPI0024B2047E|nr:porin [Bradyrhizobium sp. CB82]WFU39960.1 porin [Bradyrhizobium sp. CB82]
MKLTKSIILGSAAIFASAGAQAADLPVKAKPVEYVKVCSLYGAGFYYVPGTDTCIRLGGYLRAHANLNTNVDSNPNDSGVGAARNRLSNYYTSRVRADLQIDTRTATEYGLLRTYAEMWFTLTTPGVAGAGTTATNGSTVSPAPATALNITYGFIQFAGFTFGKAASQFSTPWGEYPGNFAELPGSSGWDPVSQVSYTADFGQGITASFSAQDPVQHDMANIWNVSGATAAGLATGTYGANDFGGTRAPDLIAAVRVDQAWGLFQASVAAHDNHAAYYGATELTGFPSDKWGWAGQLALSINNLPTGPGDSINLTGVYANGASRYVFNDYMSTNWARYGGTNLAGAYQSVGIAGLSDSVFVTGAGQELTTTYGFNGAFNHNWNEYWHTSIYGGWGAMRYNGTAKGYICGAVVTGLALSSGLAGCNPDFNFAVIGTYITWTPVKKLTFGADIAYNIVDQKYAGGSTVTLPVQAGIAKPGAVYELKDQGALSLLLRAQRNF